MNIIGITGPAGAGKDTVAAHLTRAYGFRRLAFADPIYEGLAAILGISEDVLRSREGKEKELALLGVSPRRLLQTLGTEWGRNTVAADFWLKLVDFRMAGMPVGTNVVIPDVRFQNELDFIHARGGTVFSVTRSVEPVAAHASENPDVWAAADIHIRNTSTLDALAGHVDDVMMGPVLEEWRRRWTDD